METAGFETNDMGRLSSADGLQTGAQLSRIAKPFPGRGTGDYDAAGSATSGDFTYDWHPPRRASSRPATASITWPNFWETEVTRTSTRCARRTSG